MRFITRCHMDSCTATRPSSNFITNPQRSQATDSSVISDVIAWHSGQRHPTGQRPSSVRFRVKWSLETSGGTDLNLERVLRLGPRASPLGAGSTGGRAGSPLGVPRRSPGLTELTTEA